jgi:hypothetical protein
VSLKEILAVGLFAFLIGCAVPIMYVAFLRGIALLFGRGTPLGGPAAFAAFAGSLGLASVALVYLSAHSGTTAPPVIVVAAMFGLGLIRWLRGEL